MKSNPYGIVGDGLLANHFAHYLKLESIPFTQWSRQKDREQPAIKLSACSTIILLISDDSIEPFIVKNPELKEKELVHFSGSLITEKAIGFHPLMTFSHELYDLEKYRSIPFIGSENSRPFSHFFPDLKNNVHTIDEKQKPLYHALCVLSGNITNMVWQKASMDFENKLNLPKEVLIPYLKQSCLNIEKAPYNSLTGPIKRQDITTMKRNRKALKNRTWRRIYRLFSKAYREELT